MTLSSDKMEIVKVIAEMDKEKLEMVLPEIIQSSWEYMPEAVNQIMANTGVFKSKVSESGRITIPQAERDILDIKEGDIVQIVVRKVEYPKER